MSDPARLAHVHGVHLWQDMSLADCHVRMRLLACMHRAIYSTSCKHHTQHIPCAQCNALFAVQLVVGFGPGPVHVRVYSYARCACLRE